MLWPAASSIGFTLYHTQAPAEEPCIKTRWAAWLLMSPILFGSAN